jgi:hypothetical protein
VRPSHPAQLLEGIPGGDAPAFAEHTDGLLDHDPGGERVLELAYRRLQPGHLVHAVRRTWRTRTRDRPLGQQVGQDQRVPEVVHGVRGQRRKRALDLPTGRGPPDHNLPPGRFREPGGVSPRFGDPAVHHTYTSTRQ